MRWHIRLIVSFKPIIVSVYVFLLFLHTIDIRHLKVGFSNKITFQQELTLLQVVLKQNVTKNLCYKQFGRAYGTMINKIMYVRCVNGYTFESQ